MAVSSSASLVKTTSSLAAGTGRAKAAAKAARAGLAEEGRRAIRILGSWPWGRNSYRKRYRLTQRPTTLAQVGTLRAEA
jgi:hypothetical protein